MSREPTAKIVRIARKRASKRAGETRVICAWEPVLAFCSLDRNIALIVVTF